MKKTMLRVRAVILIAILLITPWLPVVCAVAEVWARFWRELKTASGDYCKTFKMAIRALKTGEPQ